MVILIFKEANLKLNLDDVEDIDAVYHEIEKRFSLTSADYYLLSSGTKIDDTLPFLNEIHLVLKVLGGKGGFASNLRSIQVEKTSNNEACRDLNGRRLRDINNEKKLKKWLEVKKNEVIRDPEERFKCKIAKLQAVPNVEIGKIDHVTIEDTHSAVEQGLKRKAGKSPKKIDKKIKGVLLIDDISSASESDED